jgi:hypothetical protein
MRLRLGTAIIVFTVSTGGIIAGARADAPSPKIHLDLGLTFQRFEQQVKQDVGGARGDRLVEETSLGVHLSGSYRVWKLLELGLFVRADVGDRSAARFAGFAPDGTTMVEGRVGGAYAEIWIGPLARVRWKRLFAEVGYGLVALREDDARDDLVSTTGDDSGLFTTLPSVSWLFGLGADLPITTCLSASLRIEYRIRYYDERGGDPLAGDVVHGTQNLTPFVGVTWAP